MENRSLGRGRGRGRASVPVVGLGTWQRLEAAASGQHRELIDTAIAADIRLIDTSPMYGDAERLLADALGVKRDQVVIADKVWTPVPLQNRRRHCDLRFGRMSWLRQDRGLCPFDCST